MRPGARRSASGVATALGLTAAAAGAMQPAVTITPIEHGFSVDTGAIRVVIADGALVEVTNLRTGEAHAAGMSPPDTIPRGMGRLPGHADQVAQLHRPLSKLRPAPRNVPTSVLSCYRAPTKTSRTEFHGDESSGTMTWTGLSDGTRTFPDDSITVTVRADGGSGTVSIGASCKSVDRGVFGIQVPLANLHGDHRLIVPSFGGMSYDRATIDGVLVLGGGAPYFEAPVIAAEGRNGSLCMWWEDQGFTSATCFLSRTDGKFSIGLEALNPLPCDGKLQASIPTMRLAVSDGGWSAAMAPYRDWYVGTFAAEIRRREAAAWGSSIRVIVDQFDGSERGLRELASTIDPGSVMIHDWEPRAARFDTDLPDWTPRPGYAEQVLRCRAVGFRTMGYVNTYCVNAGSPVLKRDGIAAFALPRRLPGYQQPDAAPASWEGVEAGRLVYLDSLPQRWRDYHVDAMVEWNRRTRTDANYEDVGSTAGDYGNGVIEGLTGAQGGAAMFRQLLERNAGVPMASEHCADHMAFAVKWPMRYPQKWGDEATRLSWMTDLRPVTAFIHGPGSRAWVPTLNAETESARVLVAACADSLGGLAQLPARVGELRARAGVLGHLGERAALFSGMQLEPDFSISKAGDPVTCRYRDPKGGIYEYLGKRNLQQLSGPDGKPVYQRITGVARFRSDLRIALWPAHNEGGWFGLDPEAWYCLGTTSGPSTAITVDALSDGTIISRYVESRDAISLELRAQGDARTATIRLHSTRPIVAATLDDSVVTVPPADGSTTDYQVALPARFVFATAVPQVASGGNALNGDPDGRYVGTRSGICRGIPFVVSRRSITEVPGIREPQLSILFSGGSDSEILMDFLALVPDAATSVVVQVRSPEAKAGNGARVRVLLNGREAHGSDLLPQSGGHCETWRIPLGRYAGSPVLLTLACDGKGDDNCDEVWWTRPVAITDISQQPRFQVRSHQ